VVENPAGPAVRLGLHGFLRLRSLAPHFAQDDNLLRAISPISDQLSAIDSLPGC